jgi:7,8-dihydropterin-6-yl-methyl-4-(beta-D-ribofuranosyl)aminobenzene 5'-phosphate synthase
MKISIVYDNTALEGLKADWGFSCLVEGEQTILFDTGAHSDILLANMQTMGIDPASIPEVFISHDHWDHRDGLPGLLQFNPDLKIYLPHDFKSRYTQNATILKDPGHIHDHFYTTGILKRIEQSLIIPTDKGLVVIVGCSHPGLGLILEKVQEVGKDIGNTHIHAVIGGLHGFNQFEILKDVDRVCPTHCTQHIDKIKSLYPEKYLAGGAGKALTI